jgi:hypothetical protein
LADHLPPNKQTLVEINQEALRQGAQLAGKQLEAILA